MSGGGENTATCDHGVSREMESNSSDINIFDLVNLPHHVLKG